MPTLLRTLPQRLLNPPRPPDGITPVLFSPDWWKFRAEVDKWELERSRACLLVFLEAIEERFTPDIFGDPEPSTSLRVVPESELWRHEDSMVQGRAAWCYLGDAIRVLEGEALGDESLKQQLALVNDRLAAARRVIHSARLALDGREVKEA